MPFAVFSASSSGLFWLLQVGADHAMYWIICAIHWRLCLNEGLSRTRLRNEHNGHGFANRSRRSGRDVMRLMTSSRDRPLCYSHNVNVKCLIWRRFFILQIFQGYFWLSNDLQIRIHTLIPSFLAPFYREKWANARKRGDVKQWLNVHIHQ